VPSAAARPVVDARRAHANSAPFARPRRVAASTLLVAPHIVGDGCAFVGSTRFALYLSIC